jgi:hypothetical protein
MPDYAWWLIGAAVVLALVVVVVMARRGRIDPKTARDQFLRNREQLEAKFFTAASSRGKPRGLRWKAVEWERPVEFAREKPTDRLAALVGVTISFEAVEGGDMEGVAAVGNLRNASAVFFYDKGRWHTTGRTDYNLNPDEAIRHFKYEPVSFGQTSEGH